MQNAQGQIVGIRRRLPDGRKLSVAGGREGLFVPSGLWGDKTLLICEGPTDAAALLDLGFDAIGRPNCTGGVKHICLLASRRSVSKVIVVSDADVPGQRGAISLGKTLTNYVADVRIITPPTGIKDARAWCQLGATPEKIWAAIEAAAPLYRQRKEALHA